MCKPVAHAMELGNCLRPLASTSFQTRRACCALALAIELGNTLTRLSHSHRHSAPATSQQLSTQDMRSYASTAQPRVRGDAYGAALPREVPLPSSSTGPARSASSSAQPRPRALARSPPQPSRAAPSSARRARRTPPPASALTIHTRPPTLPLLTVPFDSGISNKTMAILKS
ncbi:hypothetical protein EXIGLDRAFT_727350, partial [Exidia glandulosa HHB12029]